VFGAVFLKLKYVHEKLVSALHMESLASPSGFISENNNMSSISSSASHQTIVNKAQVTQTSA
jgi:hypothetical protein